MSIRNRIDYARELLRQREDGFSIIRILKKAKRRYVLSGMILALAVTGVILRPGNVMFAILAGVYIGAFLRDYGWLRVVKRQWPYAKEVVDWEKVEAITEEAQLSQEADALK